MDAATEAYKGTASIIQGVLIALSAIIAVVGYRVQASLNRKQHVRETALKDTKILLKDSVGPAQGYAYKLDFMWLQFVCNFVYAADGNIGTDDWRGAFAKVTGDPDAISAFMKGAGYMHQSSFIGKAKEDEIRANPKGRLAIEYRRFVRRALKDGFKPLAALLKDFNIFPVPSITQFKRMYPYFATSFSLRKTIFLETLTFVSELEYLVEQEWDVEKDYAKLFPVSSRWNRAVTGYLAAQVTELKARIESLTDTAEDKDNRLTNPANVKEAQRLSKEVENKHRQKRLPAEISSKYSTGNASNESLEKNGSNEGAV